MAPAQADWLNRLRHELAEITAQAARQHWPGPAPESAPYFNYRFEHVQQVEREAKKLLAEVGGDEDIVLAAVWIHDRFQPQYVGLQHAARAAEWAQANLAALGFPAEKVERVRFAVAVHSADPGAIPVEAHEARVLWDADKLTKLGALLVVAALCANPAYPHERVTFAEVARRGIGSLPEAEALAEQFYFSVSRERAHRRLAVQKTFYQALAEDTGTLTA